MGWATWFFNSCVAAAASTGYYWQAATSDRFDAPHLEAILRHIVGR